MTKSKLTLITSAVGVLAVAVFIIGSEPKNPQPFQSVELGLAEVSPLGEAGGYAVPASGDSTESIVAPRAEISDNKNPTLKDESFKVTYGPKNENQSKNSDICELARQSPAVDSGAWNKIHTAGAGLTRTIDESLSMYGTWNYRARCGNEYKKCSVSGDNCSNETLWGGWVYLNHKVVPVPPKAEISQNKAVTDVRETFRVTYGPKAGSIADSCTLQRKRSGDADAEWTVRDTSGGNTKNPQFSFTVTGTWEFRAKCSNTGGESDWVKIEHKVVKDDKPDCEPGDPGCPCEPGDEDCDTDEECEDGDTDCPSECEPGDEDCDTDEECEDGDTDCPGGDDGGELTGEPTIVRKGDPTELTWTDVEGCSLTGPGLNMTNLTASGSTEIVVNGESSFSLVCPGGTDTVTIKVLPVIQET